MSRPDKKTNHLKRFDWRFEGTVEIRALLYGEMWHYDFQRVARTGSAQFKPFDKTCSEGGIVLVPVNYWEAAKFMSATRFRLQFQRLSKR